MSIGCFSTTSNMLTTQSNIFGGCPSVFPLCSIKHLHYLCSSCILHSHTDHVIASTTLIVHTTWLPSVRDFTTCTVIGEASFVAASPVVSPNLRAANDMGIPYFLVNSFQPGPSHGMESDEMFVACLYLPSSGPLPLLSLSSGILDSGSVGLCVF